MNLTQSQTLALAHISQYAETRKANAQGSIDHVLRMSNLSKEWFEEAVQSLFTHARVGLHFHPDRPDSDNKPVIQALLEQGVYKSQFETLISNGSVSAYPGGARDLWEKQLFGGAYQIAGVQNSERPKYGALALMQYPDGPCPRFGSCYFLLHPSVAHRCTFTYMDSYQNPPEKGTYKVFEDVLAALLSDAFSPEFVLGTPNMRPPKFVEQLIHQLPQAFSDPSTLAVQRNLDHYIEAQIHGEVSLETDVAYLVADPSFRGTQIGEMMTQLAECYSIELYWHVGFALSLEEVPDDFRGPGMPSLAKRISPSDFVSPKMIGDAVMNLKHDPASWSDRGSFKEVLQELKLLWHVLVKYGKPLDTILPSTTP